jgi:hypothetical protein
MKYNLIDRIKSYQEKLFEKLEKVEKLIEIKPRISISFFLLLPLKIILNFIFYVIEIVLLIVFISFVGFIYFFIYLGLYALILFLIIYLIMKFL